MELLAYWQLLKRRWWLVVVPAMVVLLVGLLTYHRPGPVYTVGVRFIVGQTPGREADNLDEQRYYNWTTSEYIVNGLTDWVRGNRFAELVSAELTKQGRNVPAGAIQGSLAADNTRSMMTLSLTYGNPDDLAAMMDEVILVLNEQGSRALPQFSNVPLTIVALDRPVVNAVPAGIRSQLDLPFRLALALAVGVGLAFLADYLDQTVRSRHELEALGLPVLGEIPKGTKWPAATKTTNH